MINFEHTQLIFRKEQFYVVYNIVQEFLILHNKK